MEDAEELCFPQFSNLSCRKPFSSGSSGAKTFRVWMYFIALLIVPLNLLVIITVSHFRQLHTPTNILLLSLAVSDLLMGLFIPVQILRETYCWFSGDMICFLSNYITFIIASASVGDMVLISVDRYVAICCPLHYSSRVTLWRAKVCVCLCWLCSFFYTTFLLNYIFRDPGIHSSCYGECEVIVYFIEGTVDFFVTFIVPTTTIVVLYLQVFVVAVTQARLMRSQVTAFRVQLSVGVVVKKSELKAATTLGVLVIVFLICFCPFYVLILSGDSLYDIRIKHFVIFFFFLNSGLNPLIYALFYPWFRKAFKLIMTLQILQPGSRDTKIL